MVIYSQLSAGEQLAYRKRRELCRKLGALSRELDSWLARSQEGGLFEKHHTQIRAIKAHLRGWSRGVRLRVKDSVRQEGDAFFESIRDAERLILSEHRIWEYFRGKLVQRDEDGFRRYLRVADEFAWACYSPVQRHVYPHPAHAARKEPPLVYFNGGVSPFSISRGREFRPEAVPFGGEELTGRELALANRLPIPLVGIPWHQIAHLPEALVIGHEVGHLVEDDFGLTPRLEALLLEALSGAQAEPRRGAWSAWLGEIFADVYGCLSAGPAFAGALLDFLARDFAQAATETLTEEDWGLYPTTYLRGEILIETLEVMGFGGEAAGYRELWKNLSSAMPSDFTGDVKHIVPKLLDGKLFEGAAPGDEGKSVREVFNFTDAEQADVALTLRQLGGNFALTGDDVRVLFASARASFEADPKRFARDGHEEKILARIEQGVISAGTRRAHEPPLPRQQFEEKLQNYEEEAQQLVADFLRDLNSPPVKILSDGR